MCGIAGLFLKDARMAPDLGAMLSEMLVTLSDRGPDSAGIALYTDAIPGEVKLTLQAGTPDAFGAVARALRGALGRDPVLDIRDSHAVLRLPADAAPAARAALADGCPDIRVLSSGDAIEIYKEVGAPPEVLRRFGIAGRAGSHGVGHTRMATESAVTTDGAHPYSTAPDQCLVHNGSLSNHNALRRRLAAAGFGVSSQNDTEVAAAYLSWRMQQGQSLGAALESGLEDLDGFYTFVVGTRDGFGVLRDPIACKPAVMAETDRYVAFGSEYRALAGLPGIDAARIWEPEPATVYFWKH